VAASLVVLMFLGAVDLVADVSGWFIP